MNTLRQKIEARIEELELKNKHPKASQYMRGENIVRINELRQVLSELNKEQRQEWISVEDRLPIATETGNWDGKRTGLVLIYTLSGKYATARMYTGVLDGEEFIDWYTANDDYILNVITHWQPLPQPPKQ
jgi:hypothetical protein